jgi:hypothetical protein
MNTSLRSICGWHPNHTSKVFSFASVHAMTLHDTAGKPPIGGYRLGAALVN